MYASLWVVSALESLALSLSSQLQELYIECRFWLLVEETRAVGLSTPHDNPTPQFTTPAGGLSISKTAVTSRINNHRAHTCCNRPPQSMSFNSLTLLLLLLLMAGSRQDADIVLPVKRNYDVLALDFGMWCQIVSSFEPHSTEIERTGQYSRTLGLGALFYYRPPSFSGSVEHFNQFAAPDPIPSPGATQHEDGSPANWAKHLDTKTPPGWSIADWGAAAAWSQKG